MTLTRREAIAAAGFGAGWLLVPTAGARPRPWFSTDPFTLGVASSPISDREVVLWTRLAPEPLQEGGGLDPVDLPLRWEVAEDQGFRRVVRSGTVTARAAAAHSARTLVDGLEPRRWYHYRFRAGDAVSRVGRTQTLPAESATPRELRLALVSCQRYEHGSFGAYRDLIAGDPDLVVHVGDYIYENAITDASGPRGPLVPVALRAQATTLPAYRLRHALYKTDPDLQAAHAAVPFAAILDNHDAVEDGDGAGRDALARRAVAYQAWYEHMPVLPATRKSGPRMQIYRHLRWGRLADLSLLDTRQHRPSQEACGAPPPNIGPACAPVLDAQRSMLGPMQERWVARRLERSVSRWNVVAQTVLMAPFDFTPGPGESRYLSGWDGYPAGRRRLLDAMDRASNPVVLTGDWHTSWVNQLRQGEPGRGASVATEFLAPAVSSDPAFTDARSRPAVPDNPDVRFYSARNGYVRCTVGRKRWTSDFVELDATDPAAVPYRAATWVVEDGRKVPQRG